MLTIYTGVARKSASPQYIEGRELHVGVLGNDRLRVPPLSHLLNAAEEARPLFDDISLRPPLVQRRLPLIGMPGISRRASLYFTPHQGMPI
jgi:hypothetical protein